MTHLSRAHEVVAKHAKAVHVPGAEVLTNDIAIEIEDAVHEAFDRAANMAEDWAVKRRGYQELAKAIRELKVGDQ